MAPAFRSERLTSLYPNEELNGHRLNGPCILEAPDYGRLQNIQ